MRQHDQLQGTLVETQKFQGASAIGQGYAQKRC